AVGGRHLQLAPVAGGAVVVEDDLSVEVFEAGHGWLRAPVGCGLRGQRANMSRASATPSTRMSMSSVSLYRYTDALVGAGTPSTFISGLAQWWPALTHTPWVSSTWLTSWGCTSRTTKLMTPPRSAGSLGPWMVMSSPRRSVRARSA